MSSFSNAAFIQPSPPTALQTPPFATHPRSWRISVSLYVFNLALILLLLHPLPVPSVPISMPRPMSSNPDSTLTEESCSPRRTFLRELSHKALQFAPRTVKVSFWWLLSWFVTARGIHPTSEGQHHSWCQAPDTRDTYKWRSLEWMVGWPVTWCTYWHYHRCQAATVGSLGWSACYLWLCGTGIKDWMGSAQ